MKLQDVFSAMEINEIDPLWSNAPNEWLRKLSSGRIGKIGEDFALKVLGGEKVQNNRIGYDITLGDKLIEVKLSTVQMMTSGDRRTPILVWRQIRPDDPYTHILFIAIYPSDVRMFLVSKNEIPTKNLKHQHGRGGTLEIFQ